MRDDFPRSTIDKLAKRVGYRCSNPLCRRPTSGPQLDSGKSVNLGVAAHIHAASEGGPRFDPQQTSAQRLSAENGIWLCQDCAKLVDNDPARYTSDVLLGWKQRAEHHALLELESRQPSTSAATSAGPTLVLPGHCAEAHWLSYAATSTTFRGREDEFQQLEAFIAADLTVAWWLVTGPAGSGKSRLALELCRRVEGTGQAGFFMRSDSFVGWSGWRPHLPVLIVVDYVSHRARPISDAILSVFRVRQQLTAPVRFLLLEREPAGSWWSDFCREDSYSEQADLAACQYGLPVRLGPLTDDTLWHLITEVAERFGELPSEVNREEVLAEVRRLDPRGTPLFGMIAALALARRLASHSRDSLVDAVLVREKARWRETLGDRDVRERFLNLLAYCTMTGGLKLPNDAASGLIGDPCADRLLPDADFVDVPTFNELAGTGPQAVTLPALEPDLLGELFVLDRLADASSARATKLLVEAAWTHAPDAIYDFILRAASDFPDHVAAPGLQSPIEGAPTLLGRWSSLVADLMMVYDTSSQNQCIANLGKLRTVAAKHSGNSDILLNHARAELRFGLLLLQDEQYQLAEEQFNTTMTLAPTGSAVAAHALNNRGIVRSYLDRLKEAIADYSAVIAMQDASDEARACSLNNRADMLRQKGDYEGAVRDRTAVLALKETSFNRRYIALYRRSVEYSELKKRDASLSDLRRILYTDDIVPEQKMQARLRLARLLANQGNVEDALNELRQVVNAPVLFEGTRADALVLRADILCKLGRHSTAADDYSAAIARKDATLSTLAAARLGRGLVRVRDRSFESARSDLEWVIEQEHGLDELSNRARTALASIPLQRH